MYLKFVFFILSCLKAASMFCSKTDSYLEMIRHDSLYLATADLYLALIRITSLMTAV